MKAVGDGGLSVFQMRFANITNNMGNYCKPISNIDGRKLFSSNMKFNY